MISALSKTQKLAYMTQRTWTNRIKCEGKTVFGTWRPTEIGEERRSLWVLPLLWAQSPRALDLDRQTPLCSSPGTTPALPLAGPLHSLISLGRAAPRGWGRTRVPQDSWLAGPLWDSGPDPGVREAGDTRAVTVGPQIPHPVAPALVSG